MFLIYAENFFQMISALGKHYEVDVPDDLDKNNKVLLELLKYMECTLTQSKGKGSKSKNDSIFTVVPWVC